MCTVCVCIIHYLFIVIKHLSIFWQANLSYLPKNIIFTKKTLLDSQKFTAVSNIKTNYCYFEVIHMNIHSHKNTNIFNSQNKYIYNKITRLMHNYKHTCPLNNQQERPMTNHLLIRWYLSHGLPNIENSNLVKYWHMNCVELSKEYVICLTRCV